MSPVFEQRQVAEQFSATLPLALGIDKGIGLDDTPGGDKQDCHFTFGVWIAG